MQRSKIERISLLLTLLGNVIFGFSFLFSKQALTVAAPFVLLAVRFTAAFLLMNVLVLTGKFKISLKGKNVRLLLLLGILQPFLYFICESYGIRLLSTSFTGTIIALVPVASLVLGILLLGEKVRPFQTLCALASVAGVFLTTLGQDSGSFSWLGFGLLVGAVLAAAVFTVLSRKISRQFTAFERTYVMFALGCAAFVAMALVECRGDIPGMLLAPLLDAGFWTSVLFLAGASSVGAFLMLNYALTYLDVAKVSIFANITTVISILAGVLILRESFGIYQVLGSAVIIAGVYGVNRPVRKDGEPTGKENLLESGENGAGSALGPGER
ncbi:DMT family transporter [Papillibacter cinnamivorans]|uniref:EamA domain-containing membrane protein RarD n=1 Tax=Papillibacter cinnamivorans DSM 12816 TaxID=1122930 RepID=A0A1W2CR33_9FIRM|nr:DMT family transporter [Papillibacter cinnamivorans]SMC87717.1 EamA domain-containing membrane protein RarD [Papillibacter cinnamivorans DSM 12816]